MPICHINLAKEFRGGERQTYLLMLGLSQLNTPQKLICRKNSPLAKKAKSINNLDVVEISKPFLFHIGKVKGCHLIHAHEGRSTHFAYYTSKLTKIPYIITRRIPNKPSNSRATIKAYQSSTAIVALSAAIKTQMLDYTSDLTISVIPSMRSDLNFDKNNVALLQHKYADKFVIGHIGALMDHHKGQSIIIKAARILSKGHPDLHFLFLGNGKDEAQFKKQSEGLKNIEFAGFVDNVGDYLKIFDIFVFPSREEGLGSILLDVMQFEKPIIASNVDGIPDIIKHEHNGLLIPNDAPESLAKNIIKLKNNKDLVELFTRQGKTDVDQYSVQVITQQYQKLYASLQT